METDDGSRLTEYNAPSHILLPWLKKMRIRPILFPVCLLSIGCSLLVSPLPEPRPSPAVGESLPSRTVPMEPEESAWWRPEAGATWQWQLAGDKIDTSFDVDVYDLDAFETDADVVAALHAGGRRVVCYISVGSWEDWRPDAAEFPDDAIGSEYEGWEGERWLDIRRIDELAPVLGARMDLCKTKGFDGVEPDNIDGYLNETGFPLTADDQLAFNRWLAREAHARGLAIGLKNDADQAPELAADFDFALTEDCFDQGWCELLLPFLDIGKPVWDAEYTDTGITTAEFCPKALELGVQAILKNRELDAWMETCAAL
jgi:endo-alpha-1,4-polygalactosaminidase (GH114 family)